MLATVKDPSDYEVMDLSNYLDAKFFKGERLTEEGDVFVANIDTFKNELLRIIPEQNETLRASVIERFETGDGEHEVTNRDGQKLGWLNYHFEGFPLVASRLPRLVRCNLMLKQLNKKFYNRYLRVN